jgi:hypothetical protein
MKAQRSINILLVCVQHDNIEHEFQDNMKPYNLGTTKTVVLWENELRDDNHPMNEIDPRDKDLRILGLENKCVNVFAFLYTAIMVAKYEIDDVSTLSHGASLGDNLSRLQSNSIYRKLSKVDKILFKLASLFFESIRACLACYGSCHVVEILEILGFYPETVAVIIEEIEDLMDLLPFSKNGMEIDKETIPLLREFFHKFIEYSEDQERDSWAYFSYQHYRDNPIYDRTKVREFTNLLNRGVRDADSASYVHQLVTHNALIHNLILVIGGGHRQQLTILLEEMGYHVDYIAYENSLNNDSETTSNLLTVKLLDWCEKVNDPKNPKIGLDPTHYTETKYFVTQRSFRSLEIVADPNDIPWHIMYKMLIKLFKIYKVDDSFTLPVERDSDAFGFPIKKESDKRMMIILMTSGYYRKCDKYKYYDYETEGKWRENVEKVVKITNWDDFLNKAFI